MYVDDTFTIELIFTGKLKYTFVLLLTFAEEFESSFSLELTFAVDLGHTHSNLDL